MASDPAYAAYYPNYTGGLVSSQLYTHSRGRFKSLHAVHFAVLRHTKTTSGWVTPPGTCKRFRNLFTVPFIAHVYIRQIVFNFGPYQRRKFASINLATVARLFKSIAPFLECRYDGVCFGLTNAWVWIQSNSTIRSKVKLLVEKITGEYTCKA